LTAVPPEFRGSKDEYAQPSPALKADNGGRRRRLRIRKRRTSQAELTGDDLAFSAAASHRPAALFEQINAHPVPIKAYYGAAAEQKHSVRHFHYYIANAKLCQ